jgi:hypothetical protein
VRYGLRKSKRHQTDKTPHLLSPARPPDLNTTWPVLSQSILTHSRSLRRKLRGHFRTHSPSVPIPLATFAKPSTSVSLAIHSAASAHPVRSPATQTTNSLSCFQNAIFAATVRPAPWHTRVRFTRNLKPRTTRMCMAKTSGVNSAVVGDRTMQSRNGRL